MKKWALPPDITELQSFLGLARFFRSFISNSLCEPLYSLVPHGTAPASDSGASSVQKSSWNEKSILSLLQFLSILIGPAVLSPIDTSHLVTGAPITRLPAICHDSLIAYTSRNFTSLKQSHTANERKLVALVFSLPRFWCTLKGLLLTLSQVVRLLKTSWQRNSWVAAEHAGYMSWLLLKFAKSSSFRGNESFLITLCSRAPFFTLCRAFSAWLFPFQSLRECCLGVKRMNFSSQLSQHSKVSGP